MAIEISSYQPDDFRQIETLWEEAFPDDPNWNRAAVAIPAKLAIQPELLLVARDGEIVVGTAMAGYDGHRGWLYAVAVRHSYQRRGIGRALVDAAEATLKDLGCGKVNLQVRATNEAIVGFYEALGYAIEDRVSMGKRIEAGDH